MISNICFILFHIFFTPNPQNPPSPLGRKTYPSLSLPSRTSETSSIKQLLKLPAASEAGLWNLWAAAAADGGRIGRERLPQSGWNRVLSNNGAINHARRRRRQPRLGQWERPGRRGATARAAAASLHFAGGCWPRMLISSLCIGKGGGVCLQRKSLTGCHDVACQSTLCFCEITIPPLSVTGSPGASKMS